MQSQIRGIERLAPWLPRLGNNIAETVPAEIYEEMRTAVQDPKSKKKRTSDQDENQGTKRHKSAARPSNFRKATVDDEAEDVEHERYMRGNESYCSSASSPQSFWQ